MCRHGYRAERGLLGRRRLSREDWLQRLETYQRDLEEEIADVADLIRRLKDDNPAEPASV
jgi:hypothetical protein